MSKYPALFLVTNLYKTVWFKIENDKLEIILKQEGKKSTFSDHEGSFGQGEPDMMQSEKEHEEKIHIQNIAEKTNEIFNQGEYKYFVFTVSDTIKNELAEALKPITNKVEHKLVAGNYISQTNDQLLEIFKQSLRAY